MKNPFTIALLMVAAMFSTFIYAEVKPDWSHVVISHGTITDEMCKGPVKQCVVKVFCGKNAQVVSKNRIAKLPAAAGEGRIPFTSNQGDIINCKLKLYNTTTKLSSPFSPLISLVTPPRANKPAASQPLKAPDIVTLSVIKDFVTIKAK